MKYLRRVIWYIAGRLFLVCLIAGMVLILSSMRQPAMAAF